MITSLYDPYLTDKMENLGEAFDYAFYSLSFSVDSFSSLFVNSGISKEYERNNPKYTSGLSGRELVIKICEKMGIDIDFPKGGITYSSSPEYWLGWILSYFSSVKNRSFKSIFSDIRPEEILSLYEILHEVDEEKAIDVIEKRIENKDLPTRLQRARKSLLMTQKELSIKSGVSIRTIQEYEVGSKDINKAQVKTVIELSKALNINVEDILN